MNLKFEIYKHIADLCKPNNGWTKELNYISWDGREPVYDIRTWTEDHSKYGKGVTLTSGEMAVLKQVILEEKVWYGHHPCYEDTPTEEKTF